MLNRITVEFKPKESSIYSIDINSDGTVLFTTPNKSGQCNVSTVRAKDFIRNKTEIIFRQASDVEGTPSAKAYHWTVSFYTKKGLVRTTEGWFNGAEERFDDYINFHSNLEELAGEDFGGFDLFMLSMRNARAKSVHDEIEKARAAVEDKCTPASDSVLALSQKLLTSTACENDPRKNLLISPLSVEVILSLLAYGAKGSSREELLRYMNVDAEETVTEIGNLITEITSDKAAAVANAIYTDKTAAPYLLPEFMEKVRETAATDILPSDVDSVRNINEWVSKKTHRMINELLPPGSRLGDLELLNAVAFEADWLDEYNDDNTSDGIFYRLGGGMDKARFLHSTEDYVIYDESAIGFLKPYLGSGALPEFLFMGLLPQKAKDPVEFLMSLPPDAIGRFIRSAAKIDVKVTMPEFTFDNTINLIDVLKHEGVKNIFDADTADISNMLSLPNSYISKITHKTHIEVDRHGTKASALTALGVCCAGIVEPPFFKVTLDRPFIFGIVHRRTNLPLFLGIVNTLKQ